MKTCAIENAIKRSYDIKAKNKHTAKTAFS